MHFCISLIPLLTSLPPRLMKMLKRKTQAEKDGETIEESMTVKAYMEASGKKYVTSWHCDKCGILYEPDDVILVRKHKGETQPMCPAKRRLGFQCKNHLLTGADDYWDKEFHVSDLLPHN